MAALPTPPSSSTTSSTASSSSSTTSSTTSSSSSSPTTPTTPTTTPTTPTTRTLPLRPIFLTLLLACPVLVLLPPRKLDLYTFSLAGAWVVSAEELSFGSARPRRQRVGVLGMSERGEEVGERIGNGDEMGEGEGEGEGVKGLAKKLWMGDERPGWQRRRLEREREELGSGKGYGDIIMEQVREVFPRFGRRRKGEEDGEEKEG